MAKRRDTHQIGETSVTVAGAANFIVDHVRYTARTRKSAYDTVFKAIKDAQSDGELPKGRSIPAATLFGWAISKGAWGDLEKIRGLPQSVEIAVGGVSAIGHAGYGAVVELTDEINSLKELASRQALELEQKDREIANLKARLEASLAEKQRRSATASANGKQGGRGKTK